MTAGARLAELAGSWHSARDRPPPASRDQVSPAAFAHFPVPVSLGRLVASAQLPDMLVLEGQQLQQLTVGPDGQTDMQAFRCVGCLSTLQHFSPCPVG